MGKYNEIMDHVELSEEMQSRILSNVDRHFEKKKRKRQLRIWLPVIGVAAAAAVLLLVVRPWSGRTPVSDTESVTESQTEDPITAGTETGGPIVSGTETGGTIVSGTETGGTITSGTEDLPGGTETVTEVDQQPGAFQMTEYASAAELEKAAGFPVRDLKTLPFNVVKSEYRLIAGTIAEVNYYGEDTNKQDLDLSYRRSKGEEENSGVYNEYSVKKTEMLLGVPISMQGEGELFNLICWSDTFYSYSLYSESGISEAAALEMAEEAMKVN